MRHASRIAVLAGGEPWGTSGHVTTPTCARGATTTTPRGPSATARVPVRVERTYGGSGHRATKGDDVCTATCTWRARNAGPPESGHLIPMRRSSEPSRTAPASVSCRASWFARRSGAESWLRFGSPAWNGWCVRFMSCNRASRNSPRQAAAFLSLLIDAQSNVDGSVQDGWREPVRGSASSRV
jgi:hypothetical protein